VRLVGQNYAFDPLLTKCVISKDDHLVILKVNCDAGQDSVVYYANRGYEIKATITAGPNVIMYMQKLP
jgi:hypothetical protein